MHTAAKHDLRGSREGAEKCMAGDMVRLSGEVIDRRRSITPHAKLQTVETVDTVEL
ncbi:hypothetical protein NU195Hw_Modified_592t1 [Hortaea werneckii]